ncbi:MAG: hypothetical protein HUU27_08365 [Phycisphaerae bacterium]|nr:hypothetical protein [Phycisphaerae bacterium]
MLREARSEAYEEQANDRLEAVDRCDRFLERFGDPPSRYVPNVLFLQGRALDMRIDRALLDGDECLLQFHSDVPRSASRPVWERLATRFPDSDLAAFALYQLALLDGAAGRLDLLLHGGQKLWDYAAGRLILEEAGGRMCTLKKDDFDADDLWKRSVIAAVDPQLFAAWRDWIRAQR